MQRTEIIGFCGQDAEVKDLGSNQVINFSVAVSESYTNAKGEKVTNTNWYECAKWGNNTAIAQYLKKGQQVFVSGKPQARAWQKDDGTLVSVLGINVFSLQLLGAKNDNQATSQNNSEKPQSEMPKTFVDNKETTAYNENFGTNEEGHDDQPF